MLTSIKGPTQTLEGRKKVNRERQAPLPSNGKTLIKDKHTLHSCKMALCSNMQNKMSMLYTKTLGSFIPTVS